jgi:simple sugar transport system permease protein
MISSGGTIFLMYVFTGDKGNTGNVASLSFPNVHIPFIFLLTFLIYIFLYRTRYGVSLRAVGENPEEATSLGINVKRVRMTALMMSGALSSLGGLNLSMAYLSMFANQFGSLDIPAQLVTMIPYATTIIALVVYAIQQKREIINRMKKFQKENITQASEETAKSK